MTTQKPNQTVKAFDYSGDRLHRLPKGINALSYRLAVNRHNKTLEHGKPLICLVRRSDINNGIYYLIRD